MRHTDEGQDHCAAYETDPANVPKPPPVRRKDADGVPGRGEPLERDQMTWRNARDEEIPYYMTNEDGSPKMDSGDPPRQVTNLTYDHTPPMAQRYNEYGHQQSRSERIKDFNDVDRLEPKGRRENSSKGSEGVRYTANPTGAYWDE